MKFIEKKCTEIYVKAHLALMNLKNDIAGSDTTEKIGMVVVAIVIISLLAGAVNKFMPGLFNSIFGTAQDELEGIF